MYRDDGPKHGGPNARALARDMGLRWECRPYAGFGAEGTIVEKQMHNNMGMSFIGIHRSWHPQGLRVEDLGVRVRGLGLLDV